MAFIYKRSRNANAGRELMAFTITDSQTLSVGEAVKLAAGKVSTWGAGAAGLGIVAGFQKADGSPLTDNGAGAAFAGTYTAPSSNTVQALVDISIESVYSAPVNGTIGTTNGSGQAGTNIDCDSTSLLLVETSNLAVGSTASFVCLGLDPDGSAPAQSVLVSIQESQIKL